MSVDARGEEKGMSVLTKSIYVAVPALAEIWFR